MVSETNRNLNGTANFGGDQMAVCMFITRLLIGGVGFKITPNVLPLAVRWGNRSTELSNTTKI